MIGPIADFTLTNQNGRVVSLADLRGQGLGGRHYLHALSRALPENDPADEGTPGRAAAGSQAKLVTLTTDADFDTPPVLKAYAERFQADTERWMFLTGTKREIANLAIDSLKLTAIEKKPEERESPQDLFVHSTIFVIADKQGQLRGVFETTGEGIDPQKVKAADSRGGQAIGARAVSPADLPAVNACLNGVKRGLPGRRLLLHPPQEPGGPPQLHDRGVRRRPRSSWRVTSPTTATWRITCTRDRRSSGSRAGFGRSIWGFS